VLCSPFEISVEGENKIGRRVFLKPKHNVGGGGLLSSPLSCIHRPSLERMGLYFYSPMCLDGVHKDKFAILPKLTLLKANIFGLFRHFFTGITLRSTNHVVYVMFLKVGF